MRSLLAIEWLKIKRYRTFWVLTLFFLLLLPLFNLFIYKGFVSAGANGINLLSQAYSFPDVWGNYGFWGSILILFPAMLVVILTANEYSFRTHRQNVIDGWSRLQFFHAKCGVIVCMAFFSTLYLFICAGIMGMAVSAGTSGMFANLEKVGYFFVLSLNYLGFAFFITTMIRKSGLSIGLFLLYALIIENMLKGLMNWLFPVKAGNMLPLQASDELLPLPLFRMADKMLSKTAPIPDYVYLAVTLGWIIIYYFMARRSILRRDW